MAKRRASRIKTASKREEGYQRVLDGYHDQMAKYLRQHPFDADDTMGVVLSKVEFAMGELKARVAHSASVNDPMKAFLSEMQEEARQPEAVREVKEPVKAPEGVH